MALRTAIAQGLSTVAGWLGGHTQMFGRPRDNRPDMPRGLTRDHKDLLSQVDHRDLLDACRFLFNRFPMISGAAEDKANHVIGAGWGPQFDGQDTTWGGPAEDWLIDWGKICDVRGQPYTMKNNQHLGAVTLIRDGEYFIYLNKTASGYPMLQYLESHRIGNRYHNTGYGNAAVRNGVAYNAYSRPIAYHFLGDTKDQDQWIPARNIVHVYDPRWFSQGRGVSCLALGILDWLDVLDTRENEKIAQRIFSSLALKHKNQTGKPDPYTQLFGKGGGKQSVADGAATVESEDLVTEYKKGQTRYLVINSEELESFVSNRPTMNQRAFEESILRGAFAGMCWSIEQSLDASKLGGASVRRDISKNQRSAERMQMVLFPHWFRVHGWAIARAIDIGILPAHPEWFLWEPQLPRKMTADAGREAKEEREDYKMGFLTLRKRASWYGEWWQDVRSEKETEVDDLLTRAKRLGEKHDINFWEALDLIEQRTANPMRDLAEEAVSGAAADAKETEGEEDAA